MTYEIEILKGGETFLVVDADEIGCSPSFKEDIFLYNDLFSGIVARNYPDLRYIISPTLTRIEGYTVFYDKIRKFTYLTDLIKRTDGNIRAINLDFKVALALRRHLKENGIPYRCSRARLFLGSLRRGIMFFLRLVALPLLELAYAALSKVLLGTPASKSYDYAISTYYDYRSFSGGKHREEYFGPLVDHIGAKKKSLLILNKLIHHNSPRLFFKYASRISGFRAPYEINIINRFVTPFDIAAALFRGLFRRVRLGEKVLFKGEDITCLTALSIREDFQRMWWLHNYIEYYAIGRILRKYRIGQILYPFENYPWEKLYVRARNEFSPGTKIKGFQHTSFSFKLINHFPGMHETGLPIYPDKILAAGAILKDVLAAYGRFPEGIVEEGCALRHPYLFEILERKNKTSFSRKIAYSFSFDITNYDVILKNLIGIFEGTGLTVYLKTHPDAYAMGDCFKRPLPGNFIPAGGMKWKDIFKEIDILLYDDNSLCIESLKYNIISGYFGLTGQAYNTDRLFNFEGAKIEASTVEGFRAAIDAFYRQAPDALNKNFDYNQKYLYDYFTPITPERMERFL